MAIYAIGDIQGCARSLERLLELIRFDPSVDRLWCVGDLVNRGPDSLRVLRYLKQLGPSAQVVLGNHDLFLLAVSKGIATVRPEDTLQAILAAPDSDELLTWLRHQPLLYREVPFVLVHAGVLPQWSIQEAEALAQEVEQGLRSPSYREILHALYPSKHLQWSPQLTGPARFATIIKVLTRLRACSSDGVMESTYSGPPDQIPAGYQPWFQIYPHRDRNTVFVCGHWASLGLYCRAQILALDSGCVWGRQLTAIRLEDRQVFQVEYADDRSRS